MIEGLKINNNIQESERKVYEDFRKEILAFKELPESTFSDIRSKIGKLEPQEARSVLAHGIMQRIDNDSTLTKQQILELTHLWEKEILGLSEKRIMYDGAGNVIG
jgi:hypothetical protein